MRMVYADALYYIALLVPRDTLHRVAVTIGSRLTGTRVITSEPVLVEVLAHVSGLGPSARSEVVGTVDDLRADPNVTIIPQTPALFDAGLDLYRQRPDKTYSMTDCMSMVVCRERGITGVLTYDRDFEQEGFVAMLRGA